MRVCVCELWILYEWRFYADGVTVGRMLGRRVKTGINCKVCFDDHGP